MSKNFAIVLFFVAFAFAEPLLAAPSESEFLESCFTICSEFRETTIEGLEAALKDLGQSERDLVIRRALEANIAAHRAPHFAENLVAITLENEARLVIEYGNGSRFPPAGLTAIETAAILQYSGNDFKLVNTALRSGRPSREVETYRDFLNSAIDKLPPFIGPVKRGIKPFYGWEKHYVEGATITEEGFTSTSANLGAGPYNESISIHIHSETGRDISLISSTPKEIEVIFKAGTRFKVVHIQRPEVLKGQPSEIQIELAEIH